MGSVDEGTEPAGGTHATVPAQRDDSATHALRRGDTLGRYVVLERLGMGGMGVVYAAYDPELDRKIALKLLPPPLPGRRHSARAQARLQREARALARLSHPNVVALHDVGTHDGQLWIAMEFVAGETLDAYCERIAPTWHARLDLLEQAGRGVAALHAEGLIHRDLKPANVMVTRVPARGTRVRVMDLGLARADEEASGATPSPEEQGIFGKLGPSMLTEVGATLGTPAYMAPEQHAGKHLDAAADQFGFCVLAWEVLAGERPFSGKTRAELAASILDGALRPMPGTATVPRAVRQVLQRGLAPRREDRFENMDALLTALDRARGGHRRVWLGAAFVGLGVVAWLGLGGTVGGIDPCEALADEAAAVWSDVRRDSVADRLEAVDPMEASAVLERLDARLAAWARDWGAAAQQRCAVGDPPPAEPTEDGAWGCLHRQRQSVVDQVEVAAESERWFQALDAVSSLPNPSRCLDDRLLALGVAAGPALGEDALGADVRRIASLSAAQRFREVEPLARALVESADAAGREAIAARARLHLGEALHELGHYSEAAETLREGFRQAGRAGDEVGALEIADNLVVASYDAGQIEGAEVWVDTARQLSVQLGVEGDVEGAGVDLSGAFLQ